MSLKPQLSEDSWNLVVDRLATSLGRHLQQSLAEKVYHVQYSSRIVFGYQIMSCYGLFTFLETILILDSIAVNAGRANMVFRIC